MKDKNDFKSPDGANKNLESRIVHGHLMRDKITNNGLMLGCFAGCCVGTYVGLTDSGNSLILLFEQIAYYGARGAGLGIMFGFAAGTAYNLVADIYGRRKTTPHKENVDQ